HHVNVRSVTRNCGWVLLCLWLLLSLAAPARGDESGPSSAGAADRGLAEAPVAVPGPSALAMQHYRTGQWLWALGQGWAILLPAAWLFTGASARLRDLSWRIRRREVLAIGIYFVVFL